MATDDEADGGLPAAHLIRAAALVARCLPPGRTPLDLARRSYRAIPHGGLFPEPSLIEGEEVLIAAGLVSRTDGALNASPAVADLAATALQEAASLVLIELVRTDPPGWLPFATREGDPQEDRATDHDRAVLRSLEPDPGRRQALLLALGRRVDTQRNEELGKAGEEHVVACLRDELTQLDRGDLADRVQRLSRWSDQLGYDVAAPTLAGGGRRIEVKTTAQDLGVGQVVVALSRNEADVGVRDRDWALAIVNERDDGRCQVVGWCRADAFAALLPVDRGRVARWQQAQVAINLGLLEPGLPAP